MKGQTSSSRSGWVGFVWGLAEGTFFFIVPDVFIGFAVLRSCRAGAWAWAASIGGSLVAIATIFVLQVGLQLDYPAFLESIPGISKELIAEVGTTMEEDGLPYTPWLVLTGIPLKVFGAQAFSLGHGLLSVLAWTVFARVVRIAPTYLAFALIRKLFRRHIETKRRAWFIAVSIFWLLFYAFYFYRMNQP